ncbi:hypothetical protein [Varibaculum cambriense]|uniref:hypothetical protein n=1 Tax=Varibaculum cambriense TaxID=184870 RepID=UPI002553365C|nr:hypothetical protein [Varibaculum cambriense]MDK8273689.1 hypothetical protein [Varibaculum cambriense]
MKPQKLMVLLASAALGLGLAGCAGNADASAPTYKVPTISDMDREKQILNAERDKKIAHDYAERVNVEAEAKAKAEAEAQAGAAAQAQAGSGAVSPSSGTSGRNYQPQARSNYRQGAKSRGSYQPKARPRARRGGGGGGISNDDFNRRLGESIAKDMNAHPELERDTSGVIVCVAGNC